LKNSGEPIVAIKPDELCYLQCAIRGRRWEINSAEIVMRAPLPSKIVVLTLSGDGELEFETERYTLNLATLEWSSGGPRRKD
jgi:hypothetical protein